MNSPTSKVHDETGRHTVNKKTSTNSCVTEPDCSKTVSAKRCYLCRSTCLSRLFSCLLQLFGCDLPREALRMVRKRKVAAAFFFARCTRNKTRWMQNGH